MCIYNVITGIAMLTNKLGGMPFNQVDLESFEVCEAYLNPFVYISTYFLYLGVCNLLWSWTS